MAQRIVVVLFIFVISFFLPCSPAFTAGEKHMDKNIGSYTPPSNWKDVAVVTGDVENAGTDSRVYITLFGEKKTSGEEELNESTGAIGSHPSNTKKAQEQRRKEREEAAKKPRPDFFERGQWDEFAIPGDFGRIKSIRLRHDNSGKKAGWFVFLVRVRDRQTGESDVFMINRWLAKDEGDKQIDITVNRTDHVKSILIKPPYDKYEWTNAPGFVSRARASAVKSSGWFHIYADAWIGGATAQAGHTGYFDTYGAWPIAVNASVAYVGGPINFGIASFPELVSTIKLNGSETHKEIKAPFTGAEIKERIKKIINLTSDKEQDMVKPYEEFLARVSEGQDYVKLANAFDGLQNAKEAQLLHLSKIGWTQSGKNSVTVCLRTNTGAILTGSSVIIAAGIVKSIEVVGVPSRPGLTPPVPPTSAVKVGLVELTSAAREAGKKAPGGSYKNSCGNCVLNEKGTLKCECKPLSIKGFVTTELEQADQCASGVMNAGGTLMCQGSFEKSCGNCSLAQNNRMCCNDCKDKKGNKHTHCLDSDQWKTCFAGFSNCDGKLVCGPCK